MIDYQKHRERWGEMIKGDSSFDPGPKRRYEENLLRDGQELLDKAEERDKTVKIANDFRDILGSLSIAIMVRERMGDTTLFKLFESHFDEILKQVENFPDELLENCIPESLRPNTEDPVHVEKTK